jgi:hypothetical protein
MADFGTDPQKFLFRLNWLLFRPAAGPTPDTRNLIPVNWNKTGMNIEDLLRVISAIPNRIYPKISSTLSTICSPMGMAEVAAGDGALQTWKVRWVFTNKKS